MGKHYSIEFKEEVVRVHNSGQHSSYSSVAKKYDINPFTLSNWIKKDKRHGNQKMMY